MQYMYLIGWLVGTFFITYAPYRQKQKADGRKFDWRYFWPVLGSAMIAGIGAANQRTIESADPIMELVGGFIVAVGIQAAVAVPFKPKKKVS